MKIEIEIPDWAAERQLTLLAGVELVARKSPREDYWEIKDQRCNFCGMCCHDFPTSPYGNDDEGRCKKVFNDNGKWKCMAGTKRPYNCLMDPSEEDFCCITYIKG